MTTLRIRQKSGYVCFIRQSHQKASSDNVDNLENIIQRGNLYEYALLTCLHDLTGFDRIWLARMLEVTIKGSLRQWKQFSRNYVARFNAANTIILGNCSLPLFAFLSSSITKVSPSWCQREGVFIYCPNSDSRNRTIWPPRSTSQCQRRWAETRTVFQLNKCWWVMLWIGDIKKAYRKKVRHSLPDDCLGFNITAMIGQRTSSSESTLSITNPCFLTMHSL